MSLLKQILNPFIEFEEDKKNEPAKGNKPASTPAPPVSPAVPNPAAPAAQQGTPPVQPVDVNAQHPLITGTTGVNPPNQVPAYSQSGTIAGPLPEHQQYFEQLINEANTKNPLFQGTDFKEFVD